MTTATLEAFRTLAEAMQLEPCDRVTPMPTRPIMLGDAVTLPDGTVGVVVAVLQPSSSRVSILVRHADGRAAPKWYDAQPAERTAS